jgi:hypothetical protein
VARRRHAPLRRLEADDAIIGGGNPARAAGIGTKCAITHAIGNRHRGTRRRPAGHMPDLAAPCALWCAVMRIDADAGEGEFGHIGAADHDETGAAQARYDRRIGLCRGGILKRPGAGPGHLPLDVEEILDRHGNAGVRRRLRLCPAQAIHCFGSRDSRLPVDMDECARPFAGRIGNPGKAIIDEFSGARAAVCEIFGERRKRRDVRHCFRVSLVGYLLLETGSTSRSSNAELSDLPCASSASERVTPPPSVLVMTKFKAEMLGSS